MKYEILTPSGFQIFDGFKKYDHKEHLKILTNDHRFLRCAHDHKFIVKNSIIYAYQLYVGQELADGVFIADIQFIRSPISLYDPINVRGGRIYCHDEKFVSHNSFIGSAGTLISPNILKNLTWEVPLLDREGLKVYRAPEKGKQYVIMVDPSEGVGLDHAAFSVIDITQMPYEQVATFRSNETDPHLLPDIIMRVANVYNMAYCLIELNEHGVIVSDILYTELEYENLMFVTLSGRNGQILGGGFGGKSRAGIKQTKSTKKIGTSVLKTLIENNQLLIHDFDTVSELSRFVRNKDTYAAEVGYNDDTVMSLVIFAWITKQQYFKDDMQQNIRATLHDEHVDTILESLTPIGIFHNGIDEAEDNGLRNGMVWNFH